ncbi:MAG: YqgE/AlgH family protein [Actinobacteria bacterium]|nr:YqgE/AlgH family protein [Actinomycetota bacterium]
MSMRPTQLSGCLLVATPEIDEGIFFRSVILVLHHGPDGAQGVILGRPLEAQVDAVLPGWGSAAPDCERLFQGGPVEVDSALAVARLGGDGPTPTGLRRVLPGIGLVDLDGDPHALSGMVVGLRIFAGYAGWTAGQLEAEIDAGSWYVVARESGDGFGPVGQDLWRTVLARQRGALALVASYPRDPGMN